MKWIFQRITTLGPGDKFFPPFSWWRQNHWPVRDCVWRVYCSSMLHSHFTSKDDVFCNTAVLAETPMVLIIEALENLQNWRLHNMLLTSYLIKVVHMHIIFTVLIIVIYWMSWSHTIWQTWTEAYPSFLMISHPFVKGKQYINQLDETIFLSWWNYFGLTYNNHNIDQCSWPSRHTHQNIQQWASS